MSWLSIFQNPIISEVVIQLCDENNMRHEFSEDHFLITHDKKEFEFLRSTRDILSRYVNGGPEEVFIRDIENHFSYHGFSHHRGPGLTENDWDCGPTRFNYCTQWKFFTVHYMYGAKYYIGPLDPNLD